MATPVYADDGGTLSLQEEEVLALLREMVAEMRSMSAVANLSYVGRAIEAAGGVRVRAGTDRDGSEFVLNRARFSIRLSKSQGEKIEVTFIEGESC
jgi:hypothetical protein